MKQALLALLFARGVLLASESIPDKRALVELGCLYTVYMGNGHVTPENQTRYERSYDPEHSLTWLDLAIKPGRDVPWKIREGDGLTWKEVGLHDYDRVFMPGKLAEMEKIRAELEQQLGPEKAAAAMKRSAEIEAQMLAETASGAATQALRH